MQFKCATLLACHAAVATASLLWRRTPLREPITRCNETKSTVTMQLNWRTKNVDAAMRTCPHNNRKTDVTCNIANHHKRHMTCTAKYEVSSLKQMAVYLSVPSRCLWLSCSGHQCESRTLLQLIPPHETRNTEGASTFANSDVNSANNCATRASLTLLCNEEQQLR